jgi:hypothetical protein
VFNAADAHAARHRRSTSRWAPTHHAEDPGGREMTATEPLRPYDYAIDANLYPI